MSQAGFFSGGSGPPPIVVRSYTNVVFSGGTNTYTVLPTDEFISVDPEIPGTIILPSAPTQNQEFVIKDRTGMSSTNNITVTAGSSTIDLAASKLLNDNFVSISLHYHSGNYEIF